MKYEFDYETLELTDEQLQLVQMGLAKIDDLNSMVKDIINERAAKGWEPMYPFSVPSIWFRKPRAAKRKKTTRKKTTKSS